MSCIRAVRIFLLTLPFLFTLPNYKYSCSWRLQAWAPLWLVYYKYPVWSPQNWSGSSVCSVRFVLWWILFICSFVRGEKLASTSPSLVTMVQYRKELGQKPMQTQEQSNSSAGQPEALFLQRTWCRWSARTTNPPSQFQFSSHHDRRASRSRGRRERPHPNLPRRFSVFWHRLLCNVVCNIVCFANTVVLFRFYVSWVQHV